MEWVRTKGKVHAGFGKSTIKQRERRAKKQNEKSIHTGPSMYATTSPSAFSSNETCSTGSTYQRCNSYNQPFIIIRKSNLVKSKLVKKKVKTISFQSGTLQLRQSTMNYTQRCIYTVCRKEYLSNFIWKKKQTQHEWVVNLRREQNKDAYQQTDIPPPPPHTQHRYDFRSWL